MEQEFWSYMLLAIACSTFFKEMDTGICFKGINGCYKSYLLQSLTDFTISTWNPDLIQELHLLMYRMDVGLCGFLHGVMETEYFTKYIWNYKTFLVAVRFNRWTVSIFHSWLLLEMGGEQALGGL